MGDVIPFQPATPWSACSFCECMTRRTVGTSLNPNVSICKSCAWGATAAIEALHRQEVGDEAYEAERGF